MILFILFPKIYFQLLDELGKELEELRKYKIDHELNQSPRPRNNSMADLPGRYQALNSEVNRLKEVSICRVDTDQLYKVFWNVETEYHFDLLFYQRKVHWTVVEVIFNFWFYSIYTVISIQLSFCLRVHMVQIKKKLYFQIWDNLQDGLYIR